MICLSGQICCVKIQFLLSNNIISSQNPNLIIMRNDMNKTINRN